jgi:hypothetical protein
MPKHALEAQLLGLTQEFVSKLVDVIRNASFADVAALPGASSVRPSREPREPQARAPRAARAPAEPSRKGRQTAATRAEMGERVLEVLRAKRQPLGVRALASELGVAPDLLAAPLKELRASSKIRKHGEKRATTYSI